MSTAVMIAEKQPAELVLLQQAEQLEVYTSSMERRLIKAAGISPILEFPVDTQHDELANLFEWIFQDMGLRKAPTTYDVERFLIHIDQNHPRFTITDVRSAFEMYLGGRFDDKLPERHDHYQQFSVAFYAKILKHYAQAQAEARHLVRHRVEKAQLRLKAPEVPKDLTDFRSLSIIREHVRAFLDIGARRIHMLGFTHDWLVRLGVCTAVEPCTDEEKIEALRRMKERKGVAVAFTWQMQRILAGEKVDDVEWEALCHKRTEAMFREITAKGREALAIIDAELERVKARAMAAGVNLDETIAA